jgi:putative ABC transport system permease protein
VSRLFGVPIDTLLLLLLGLFVIAGVILAVSALRNRIAFRLALRNIPRRPAQTSLILLGLMLATLLFSAAFSTGDTMTHSLRVQATRTLGEVDILIEANQSDAFGRPGYFGEDVVAETAAELVGDGSADGVSGMIRESAPVVSSDSGLSEPRIEILGIAADRPQTLGVLVSTDGSALQVGSLRPGEVYLSEEAASSLEVGQGDIVQLYSSTQPDTLVVAGIVASGAEPAGDVSLVLPLDQAQVLFGHPGEVNAVVVSNSGTGPDAAALSDSVLDRLDGLLTRNGLEGTAVKQERLDEAEELGNFFSSIFLLFAQFSVAAGILLIFLIFVMLAAERKHELGMARAVGAQRGHVVRMFVYEGFMYALLASIVGSLLGVMVGWGMVRILRVAIDSSGFDLDFTFNWRSVLIAYFLGTVFTLIIVLISSWRVSRLNIVRAVRDLPEPRIVKRSRKRLVGIILLLVAGVGAFALGLQTLQAGTAWLGVSLFLIGLALLARRLGVSERVAFTIAGLALVITWIIPSSWIERVLPDMSAGIELFFLSGIMLVIGGVWVVIFNTDIILRIVVAVLGRIRGLPAVLKTAVTYPTLERFRTGMTLAMLSLVVFTLVIMSFIISSIATMWEDQDRLSGGYELRAAVGYANPVDDLEAEWAARASEQGMRAEDFAVIAGQAATLAEVSQVDGTQGPGDFYVQGVDEVYSETTLYEFVLTAPGYETPRDVWVALQEEPDTAVVVSYMVPTKSSFSFSSYSPPIMLEGFWIQDEALPEDVYLSVTSAGGGEARRLHVIGVLDTQAAYAGQIVTSRETLEAVAGQPLPTIDYMIGLAPGVDAEEAGRALEKAFVANGLQAEPIEAEIREMTSSSLMVNSLLQGFMALGLVVGIAALGVIAARSVVERRRQIGVLRALGFQKSMVQLSFLLESSFVALLGIGLGVVLAVGLSPGVVDSMSEEFEGLSYDAPVRQIILICVVAYLASLVTTYLPSRQASKVYPAEALRYE